MKVLVYGAGVIGCYLTHVLCTAGNDVTLLARGEWNKVLKKNGLIIHHHLQKKTTSDHPKIVEKIDFSQHYDVIFSVMSYHQVGAILDDLAGANADTVVLVGNNLSAPEIERYIREHAVFPKEILFAFQATAGKREKYHVVCERLGKGGMYIGYMRKTPSDSLKRKFAAIFNNTNYKLHWQDDMDSFLKCHAAAILPLAYLAYVCDCDFKKSTKTQRKLSIDASAEGFKLLMKLGYSVVPKGEDKYYRCGIKRLMMQFVMYIMAKTVLGELAAAAHCRHSVSEMEWLDTAWNNLRQKASDFSMPNWNKLYALMPKWEDIH